MTRHSFEAWASEQLRDPDFVEELETLEAAFQVTRLRVLRGLTQEQLAERVGTQQSSISRLENGKQTPSLAFLKRVAKSLDARLEIVLRPIDDVGVETLLNVSATPGESETAIGVSETDGWQKVTQIPPAIDLCPPREGSTREPVLDTTNGPTASLHSSLAA